MKNAILVFSGVALGLLAIHTISRADAQAAPAAPGAGNGTTIVATGGGAQNQNDLLWVLTKVKPVKGPERTVLALYRAKQQGEYFDLEDVRAIDADVRVVELQAADHKKKGTDFQSILKQLPKEEQEAILPPREQADKK